jgi:septum formation protein
LPPLHLILASASPRRRELLEALGVDFDIVVPDVEEITEGASPAELVLENARRKARAAVASAAAGEGSRVLAVDTDVALDGRLVGKAADERGARQRLEALSGRTHEVLSGIVLLAPHPDGDTAPERTAVETARVTFAPLSGTVIDRYLASGEWRDRAGAYAVQGLGAMLVERVEGDLSNVIGLPLRRLLELLPGIAQNPNPNSSP